jgi:hypothetical protein
MKIKYGRTGHLPWSEGVTSDDKIIESLDGFIGQEVVVSLKLDGENSAMAKDYTHARSLDSRHHWSRSRLKQLHAELSYYIPDHIIIYGENLVATHSIKYDNLKSYFYVFNILDTLYDTFFAWDDLVETCSILELTTVPVIYRGIWDEELIKNLPIDLTKDEGYVVRVAGCFGREEFPTKVAKFVRKGHIREECEHWMNKPETEINLLKP